MAARADRTFVVVGGIALAIAAADAGWTAHFLGRATRTEATVVSAAMPMGTRGRGGSFMWRRDVIVSYPAGERVMQTRHRASFFEGFYDGGVVAVAYDP